MSPLLESISVALGVVFVSLLLGLAALLLGQTLVACFGRRAPRELDTPAGAAPIARPRLAVLVPAHDEADGIAATLATIVPQLQAGDRLVVIADNCADATAAVARDCGATVIERSDAVQRGKGFALDFGLRQLRADPPDVVVMFDADCKVGSNCIQTLVVEAEVSRHPVQARYLIRASSDGVLARLSEFAYRVRNLVRPIGMLRLDMPCQLMGCGMAFHWSLLQEVSLASGHLTEDLQLGFDFARRRRYPRFCPLATVDSLFAFDPTSATVQRTRWEHGHLGTIVSQWPGLAATSLRRFDVRLGAMAWDLAMPPLALFVSVELLGILVSSVVGAWIGVWWPLVCIGFAMAMIIVTMVLSQRYYARDLIGLNEIFLAAPLYLLRKIPVYLRFLFFQRQVEWIRTKRDVG